MRALFWGLGGLGAAAAGALAYGYRRYRRRTEGPFEPSHYVWSRGLALLCDHNGGVDFVKRQRGGRRAIRFDPQRFAAVRRGDLVWTRHIALPQFVAEALPLIREPFSLVTGDEDWSIPSDFDRADELLRHPLLVCWFTQNYDGTDTSGKVVPIPIGLDFHTISNQRKWGHWPESPAAQEADLKALVARARPNRERVPRVHCDFHFNKHVRQNNARAELHDALGDSDVMVYQERKVRRLELWENKTHYAFVVSPHGVGLDCHRTWESLVLGNIVIVKRSSLDPLYAGLPVVIVDDWREVTADSLARWHEQYADSFADPEVQRRLTNDYWIEHMRAITRAALEK